MSGLFNGIQTQAQALSAQSIAIATTGKNLSNVNNPAYSRETVNLASTAAGGLEVTNIISTRNSIIDNQILRQLATQGSLSAQSDGASTLQSILGEQINTATDQTNASGSSTTSNQTGLATALDNFFNAFSQLASDPSQDSYKQTAISSAQNLTDQLNYLSQNLDQTTSDITTQIDTQAQSAQGLLSDIASINGQIAQIEVNKPGSALDLRDQRQSKLEALAKYMNFSVVDSPQGLGQINIVVPSTYTDPATGVSVGGTTTLVSNTIVNGTLAYDGSNFNNGAANTTLNITGGSLAGAKTAITGTVTNLRNALNSIAGQLVSSVNAAYNTGDGATFFRTDAGNPNFYTSAGDIQLNPTLLASPTSLKTGATTAPGDNSVAQSISDLAHHSFGQADAITGTFADYYNGQVTAVGEKVASLKSQSETSALVYNNLVSQRQSESGVSTDEETSNLMIFQRAYQATARVISVMDTLLADVVTNMT